MHVNYSVFTLAPIISLEISVFYIPEYLKSNKVTV